MVTDAPGLAGALADFAPTVVFDPLGNGFTESALACMAPYGRLVVFGTSAGLEARLQLRPLYRSGQRILGYAGLRLTQAQRREGLGGALQAFADGRLRLRVGRTLRLDEVNQAFPLLTNREVVGKVVLELR